MLWMRLSNPPGTHVFWLLGIECLLLGRRPRPQSVAETVFSREYELSSIVGQFACLDWLVPIATGLPHFLSHL